MEMKSRNDHIRVINNANGNHAVRNEAPKKKQLEKGVNLAAKPQSNTNPLTTISIEYRTRTRAWTNIKREDIDAVKPFSHGKMYTGTDSIDAMARNVLRQRAVWRNEDEVEATKLNPTAKEWEKLFRWILDGRNTKFDEGIIIPKGDQRRKGITHFILSLASTDPCEVFQSTIITGTETMRISRPGLAWYAAVKILGCNYKLGTNPGNDNYPSTIQTTIDNHLGVEGETNRNGTNEDKSTSPRSGNPSDPKEKKRSRKEPQSKENTAEMEVSDDEEKSLDPDSISTNSTSSESATEQTQMKIGIPKKIFTTRFDVKFKITTPERNPAKALRGRIKSWWEQVKLHCPTAVIIPWKDIDAKHGYIDKWKDAPKEIHQFDVFFPRIKADGSGIGASYTAVRITADTCMDDIVSSRYSEMNNYYYANIESMYERILQNAESTITIGFLSYSGGFTDIRATCKLINERLRKNNIFIEVGGRTRDVAPTSKTIKDAFREKSRRHWTLQPWRAVHIETDRKDAKLAVKEISKMFNRTTSVRPGGLHFRFVPDRRYEKMDTKKERFIEGLTQKHRAVISALQYISLDGVEKLDDPCSNKRTTLRKFLLGLKTTNGAEIFHSVDMMRGGEQSLVAHVFPEYTEEARRIFNQLVLMCKREIDPNTERWFTPELIMEQAGTEYDETTKEYITADNNFLETATKDSFPKSTLLEGMELLETATFKPGAMDNHSLFSRAAQSIGSRTARSMNGSVNTTTSIKTPTNIIEISQEVEESIAAAAEIQNYQAKARVAEKDATNKQLEIERLRLQVAALKETNNQSNFDGPPDRGK